MTKIKEAKAKTKIIKFQVSGWKNGIIAGTFDIWAPQPVLTFVSQTRAYTNISFGLLVKYPARHPIWIKTKIFYKDRGFKNAA